MPSVTIIIPNYNHALYLKQRIDSVLNETFQDFEVIILDDASTDDSRDIIEQYRSHPKVKTIIYNSTNSGSAFKQWQKGIELAKGEYIWIAESDDYNEDVFLDTAIETLNKDKSSLFFCQSHDIDETNKVKGDFFWSTGHLTEIDWSNKFTMPSIAFVAKALQYQNVIINASCVVFKNSKFDFRKIIRYKTCGDWLFWVNLLNDKNGSISYSPEKMNYFRSHPDTTRNLDNKYKYVQRIAEEISVKYEFYKLHLITKKQFNHFFLPLIDKLTAYPLLFKDVCKQLGLPNIFMFQFFNRKLQLKIRKLIN